MKPEKQLFIFSNQFWIDRIKEDIDKSINEPKDLNQQPKKLLSIKVLSNLNNTKKIKK